MSDQPSPMDSSKPQPPDPKGKETRIIVFCIIGVLVIVGIVAATMHPAKTKKTATPAAVHKHHHTTRPTTGAATTRSTEE
jgi:hypothetical protein